MDWTSWLIFLYGGWMDSRPGSIMPEKSPDQGRNSSDVAIHEFSLGPVSRCKGAMECISRPFTAELRQGARSMLEISRSACEFSGTAWPWAGGAEGNLGEACSVLRPSGALIGTTHLYCISGCFCYVRPRTTGTWGWTIHRNCIAICEGAIWDTG